MAKKKITRLSSKLTLSDSGTLPKADVLERWHELPTGKQLNPEAAEYGEKGSAYERDSIRVCGSLKFLDAVMSNLKGLLKHENTRTLLDISYCEQKERGSGKRRPGQYTLYVQVKEKARTTRAKSTTPARAKAAKQLAVAKVAPLAAFVGEFTAAGRAVVKDCQATQLADALAGLLTLGYKRPDAEQRLAVIVEQHGKMLGAAEYIKLVLNSSK